MDAVRTPLNQGPALALGNKRYRKEVLKLGDIHYRGGIFPVTADYLDKVQFAFDAKAIPKVPFQLADAKNTHTQDPLRQYGSVTALHRTPAGLDAVIEVNDEAARLIDEYDLGVSVYIEPDRTTGEGQHFDQVLLHVLGTTDPVLTSLSPWTEALAASNGATPGPVLDLLALSAPQKEGSTMADTATLTPEDVLALRSLASVAPALVKLLDPADPDEPAQGEDDAGDDEFTDAEIQALADTVTLDDTERDTPLAASHDTDDEVLALSQRLDDAERARRDDQLQLAQLREERDETRYLAQRDDWARRYGVHPSVTDIVKPLIKSGGQKLALANGAGDVDPAALVAKFLHEYATRPRLDLSQAKGTATDLDDNDPDARQRDLDAFLAQAKAELNH